MKCQRRLRNAYQMKQIYILYSLRYVRFLKTEWNFYYIIINKKLLKKFEKKKDSNSFKFITARCQTKTNRVQKVDIFIYTLDRQ